MIGDGAVLVTGEVVSEDEKRLDGCELAMFLEGAEESFDEENLNYVVSIDPVFSDGFTISPLENSYYFVVRCPGYSKPYRSRVYRFDGGTYMASPLNLGTIVMKK